MQNSASNAPLSGSAMNAKPEPEKEECDRRDALRPPVVGTLFCRAEAQYLAERRSQTHGRKSQ
jgi:hypothetical protein